MKRCLAPGRSSPRRMPAAFLAMAVLLLSTVLAETARAQQNDVVAHEWGTFTSIAGTSGSAVQWYPWAAPAELPGFVEHLQVQARDVKLNLNGTIRMETPVLYFYSSRETALSVHVSFSKGLITEWYPHATRFTPGRSNAQNASFPDNRLDGSVTWENIALRPNLEGPMPRERAPSLYYAARDTSSTPLQVATLTGAQYEKFLFYRGVSSEAIPVAAKVLADGRIEVTNFSRDSIRHLFLFERRGTLTGVRSTIGLGTETKLTTRDLNATVETVSEQVLAALMDQGLYPDEARAMLETWKDSWFEEGSRLLYLVPREFVDRVLPLSISPEPAQTTRVFVGRLELVTPRTRSDIESALASRDEPALRKYNRFLEPMLQILLERECDPQQAEAIRQRLGQPYSSPVKQRATTGGQTN